eukprot:TRINITY_DN3290_c0_g1_i1.p1 TRINITY_DN3290_c0_g1~~TRINITY_DN3290_c0_g1_i1.p1  ORF type:complete len:602 (-),score=88.33 TRINITY_DN3290_c0_g1_i1:104-1909(-)
MAVKRTICRFWSEGNCARGSACGFAHGEQDLGVVVPSASVQATQTLSKRTLCRFWQEGSCQRGPLCGFAHGDEELGMPVPVAEEMAPAEASENQIMCQQWMESSGQDGSEYPLVSGTHAEKRTLCKFWLGGHCDRGSFCSFAHGEHEIGQPAIVSLENPQTAPSVSGAAEKRTVCKFWLNGQCERGSNCGFAHGEHELGQLAPQPSQDMCERGSLCTFAHGVDEVGQVAPSVTLPSIQHAQPAQADDLFEAHDKATEKRTLCKYWLEGTCDRGMQCGFAHGEHEIGQPGPGHIVASQVLEKRTICKFWVEGNCERGDNCGFAHGEQEIGQSSKLAVENALLGKVSRQEHTGAVAQAPGVMEKRTICKFWSEGCCERGNSCGFAHGSHELGQPALSVYNPPHVQLPQQASPTTVEKRTICKFWQEGHCDRGRSCTFAHGEQEVGQHAPVHAPGKGGDVAQYGGQGDKRTICKFWREGHCERGLTCTFAHGEHELGQQATGMHVICKFWIEGSCKRGSLCNYSHRRDGLDVSGRAPHEVAIEKASVSPSGGSGGAYVGGNSGYVRKQLPQRKRAFSELETEVGATHTPVRIGPPESALKRWRG